MTFDIGFYAYAIIGHTRANQLLPQLLMEQGSLTLAMGKCLWFSVKIKVCQLSLSSP